jgi:sigma-B regulation protein RsbU (phosphoserine phosphatase)
MNYSSQSGFRILVVDDEIDLESLIRQKFRRQIREKVYDFVFAFNGLEALTKLLEYPEIGIVLTDINMPEMDGLTLLAKLKELKNQGLKTVIVSAYGDMDNIRTAMNRGAYDFITKPVNFEDLEITINKTIDEIMQIRRSMEEHDQLISIQHDLNVAREIQQAILPKIFSLLPEKQNFDIYASMVAAREVGGDFYDFFLVDSTQLGFVIGDVSGKGVPAAIFMAVSRTLIRATGIKGVSAGECMRYVNKLLCNESVASMFVTIFYGILDLTTGEVEFVNAGHNPPYLISSSGITKVEITGDTVLGVFDDISFRTGKIKMNPGDKLFLFTDGVTEAFNNREEVYGEERLESLLMQHLALPVNNIVTKTMESVKSYVDGAPQSDDITLLSISLNDLDGQM